MGYFHLVWFRSQACFLLSPGAEFAPHWFRAVENNTPCRLQISEVLGLFDGWLPPAESYKLCPPDYSISKFGFGEEATVYSTPRYSFPFMALFCRPKPF